MNDKDVPLRELIVGPAIVTVLVTTLRLTGEVNHWSERFFSRAPGGPGSLVGIVWLVPLFGLYFGWKLGTWGQRPKSSGRAFGLCLAAIGVVVVSGFAVNALKLGPAGQITGIAVAGLLAAYLGYLAWPMLGRVLLSYGIAARVPVVIVMLIAIMGNWGTHYDVVPPDFPEMNPWAKWFLIGLVPQLTFWIGFTIVVGTLFGLLGVFIVRKHAVIEVGREILEATKQGR